jgi:hypothetical protein
VLHPARAQKEAVPFSAWELPAQAARAVNPLPWFLADRHDLLFSVMAA